PIDDMARAFDANQPVVVVDAQTKARHLVWAEVDGTPPAFTVTKVTDFTPAQNSNLIRRVEGTFTVPCYLDLPGCPSGSRFAFDPTKTNGPPVAIPGNTTTARFTCNIPRSAANGTPARVSLYGHGLFGSRDEVNQRQA